MKPWTSSRWTDVTGRTCPLPYRLQSGNLFIIIGFKLRHWRQQTYDNVLKDVSIAVRRTRHCCDWKGKLCEWHDLHNIFYAIHRLRCKGISSFCTINVTSNQYFCRLCRRFGIENDGKFGRMSRSLRLKCQLVTEWLMIRSLAKRFMLRWKQWISYLF